jgi:hypothetical protein
MEEKVMGKALVLLLAVFALTLAAEIGAAENELRDHQALIATPLCASLDGCTHGKAECHEGLCNEWKLSLRWLRGPIWGTKAEGMAVEFTSSPTCSISQWDFKWEISLRCRCRSDDGDWAPCKSHTSNLVESRIIYGARQKEYKSIHPNPIAFRDIVKDMQKKCGAAQAADGHDPVLRVRIYDVNHSGCLSACRFEGLEDQIIEFRPKKDRAHPLKKAVGGLVGTP